MRASLSEHTLDSLRHRAEEERSHIPVVLPHIWRMPPESGALGAVRVPPLTCVWCPHGVRGHLGTYRGCGECAPLGCGSIGFLKIGIGEAIEMGAAHENLRRQVARDGVKQVA
jgi:hypothetical protein